MVNYSEYLFEFSVDQIVTHDLTYSFPVLVIVEALVIRLFNDSPDCLAIVTIITAVSKVVFDILSQEMQMMFDIVSNSVNSSCYVRRVEYLFECIVNKAVNEDSVYRLPDLFFRKSVEHWYRLPPIIALYSLLKVDIYRLTFVEAQVTIQILPVLWPRIHVREVMANPFGSVGYSITRWNADTEFSFEQIDQPVIS